MDDNSPTLPHEEAFDFPDKILDQISECSPEGFMLFTINERGEVELFTKQMAQVVETGLRAQAIRLLNTLTMVEDSDVVSQMLNQKRIEENPEEGEGESGEDVI